MDNVDMIYKNMKDDTEADLLTESSKIANFFAGKTVFITGATGFLGKSLLEKLVRSCPDIKKIYFLVRESKRLSMEEKVKKCFKDVIFNPVMTINPGFQSKIVPIRGDLSVDKLDLSEEDRQKIIDEVDIMYHNGATVKFNEKLSLALKINVLGTKNMLDLAMACKHLKAFVYISTAYSHSYNLEIEEKFYPALSDIKIFEDLIAADTDNEAGLDPKYVDSFRGQWSNIYTLTKSFAEELVRIYSHKCSFPCAVYRPSIVVSTCKEPLVGWCCNLNGPTAIFLALSLGLMHVGFNKDQNFDMVPCDMCTNSLLALTWDIVEHRTENQEAKVFNYASSTVNPITLPRLHSYVFDYILLEPSIKTVYWPCVYITQSMIIYYLLHFILHFIPCVVADAVYLLQRKSPKAVSTFFKYTKLGDMIWDFSITNWRIHVTEMQKVWDKMSPIDKELFFCDLRKLDWEEYSTTYWRGLRYYVLKESDDNLKEARKRIQKLKRLHYVIVYTLLFFIIYYVYKLFVKYFL